MRARRRSARAHRRAMGAARCASTFSAAPTNGGLFFVISNVENYAKTNHNFRVFSSSKITLKNVDFLQQHAAVVCTYEALAEALFCLLEAEIDEDEAGRPASGMEIIWPRLIGFAEQTHALAARVLPSFLALPVDQLEQLIK